MVEGSLPKSNNTITKKATPTKETERGGWPVQHAHPGVGEGEGKHANTAWVGTVSLFE